MHGHERAAERRGRPVAPVTRVAVGLRFGATRAGDPVPDRRIGTLALDRGIPVFFYDSSFLADPLPLSPFHMPVRLGAFRHAERDFEWLPGLLADALPDGWGRLLHDRAFQRAGRGLDTVTALDRLVAVGHAAMGALVFDPVQAPRTNGSRDVAAFDLADIAAQAQRLIEGSDEEVLPALQLGGGSPGGARPKALIGLRRDAYGVRLVAGVSRDYLTGKTLALPADYDAWLVKFASDEDRRLFGPDVGAVEACYAEMARRAGLAVPETMLLTDAAGTRHFAIARFDRFGPGSAHRVHMHTAGGLLHASFRLPSLDYNALFQLTWALTHSYVHVRELFRRMAFNVFAYNRDDHAKNFAYIMESDGTWALAPGYDLMFSTGINGRHSTSIDGVDDWPTRDGLLRLGQRHQLTSRDMAHDLDQVLTAVASGPALASKLGCAPTTRAALQLRFEEVRRRA